MPLASREKTILFAGFLAIIIMMALIALVGFRQLQLMETDRLNGERGFDKIRAVYQMRDAVRKRSFSLTRVSTLPDFFDRDAEQQRFFGYARDYILARDRFIAAGLLPEEEALLEETSIQLRAQQPLTERIMALLVDDLESVEGRAGVPHVLRAQTQLLETLNWIVSHQEFLSQKRKERSELQQRQTRNIFLFAAASVLILSLMIAIYITRQEGERTAVLIRENKQRQWAEQKVRDLNRDLEMRVDERTRDLQDEILERQRAEERLRESETRSRIIVDSAAAGIITISETGIIESFNPAAEEIFGFDADRVIGENVSMLMPDPDKGRHDGYLKAYLETGRERIIGIGREVKARKDDGVVFQAYLSIGEFEIGGGRKFVGMIEDITEQKFAEEQILGAKEEAELANQAKSDFLANMSHELRTPLNAVIGYSEAMKMEMFGPLGHDKYKEYMINIIHSGRHLLDLVNDILDISAIEAGRMELNEEVFDLSGLTRETIEHIRGWADREGVEVHLQSHGARIWVRADRRRLRQIILNLLSNAIKFTPADGTITVAVAATPEGAVKVSVSDTGPGLASEDIPKAFSPFQQIGRGTASRHEGSGLGLPLSHSFARLHDGNLHMESVIGEGTTVYLVLPEDRQEKNRAAGASA